MPKDFLGRAVSKSKHRIGGKKDSRCDSQMYNHQIRGFEGKVSLPGRYPNGIQRNQSRNHNEKGSKA